MLVCITLMLTGCTEADKVNYNISKQADYFESVRRVTVYNARTDKVIFEIEGLMSISNSTSGELVVTCKIAEGQYKKNYVFLFFRKRIEFFKSAFWHFPPVPNLLGAMGRNCYALVLEKTFWRYRKPKK